MTPKFEAEANMLTDLSEEARKLSVSERIQLVEEIWDSIAEDNGCFELTDQQKEELDRRLASLPVDSSQARTWYEIKEEFFKAR